MLRRLATSLIPTLVLATCSSLFAACSADQPADEEPSAEGALTGASAQRPTKRFLGHGDPNRRVLIVTSTADTIEMIPDENHSSTTFVTGVFAREMSEPLKVLAEAGYSFDIASPNGDTPTWDVNGLELSWFFWGDSDSFPGDRVIADAIKSPRARDEAVSLLMEAVGSLKYAKKKTLFPIELPSAMKRWTAWEQAENMKPIPPKKLSEVADAVVQGAAANKNPYVAVFVPGGHAPMNDLGYDPDMGRIMKTFHAQKLPIGVVCHGPVSLLSTVGKRSYKEWQAMTDEERQNWEFHGYTMTVESTIEEHIMEVAFAGGQKVAYYVDGELQRAGAILAPAWPEHVPGLAKVSADRELVSGQSPASAKCLGQTLDESIKLSMAAPGTEWWTARKHITCDGQDLRMGKK